MVVWYIPVVCFSLHLAPSNEHLTLHGGKARRMCEHGEDLQHGPCRLAEVLIKIHVKMID